MLQFRIFHMLLDFILSRFLFVCDRIGTSVRIGTQGLRLWGSEYPWGIDKMLKNDYIIIIESDLMFKELNLQLPDSLSELLRL